jgi:hypothetical protein
LALEIRIPGPTPKISGLIISPDSSRSPQIAPPSRTVEASDTEFIPCGYASDAESLPCGRASDAEASDAESLHCGHASAAKSLPCSRASDAEVKSLLRRIDEGNRATGGLTFVTGGLRHRRSFK